jgi:hydrophobic/amphiphilic exporter-1 (mainly G- bacteria), HAE1 family
VGLIMAIGIIAKNGILLLDARRNFRTGGIPAEDGMIRAGERRLRPIMMTAPGAAAGMIPPAPGIGSGSQMLQPWATAATGGPVASMVLTLVSNSGRVLLQTDRQHRRS